MNKPIDNIKGRYWSAGDFIKGVKRKKAFEMNGPGPQCNQSRCGPVRYMADTKNKVLNNCYICGYPIDEKGGYYNKNPGGYQCEHVLTASAIAMICGLNNTWYYDEINDIFKIINNKELETKFHEFRKKLIGGKKFYNEPFVPYTGDNIPVCVYQWSHPACNLIKTDFPFILIDFTINGPIIKGIVKQNIRWVLNRLLDTTKKDDRALHWRQKFTGVHNETWVNERIDIVSRGLDSIISILKEYEGNGLLNKFSFISVHVLYNIVKKQILSLGKKQVIWATELQKFFEEAKSRTRKLEVKKGGGSSADPPRKKLKKMPVSTSSMKTNSNRSSREVIEKATNYNENNDGSENENSAYILFEVMELLRGEEYLNKDELVDHNLHILADTAIKAEYYSNDTIFGALLLMNLSYRKGNIMKELGFTNITYANVNTNSSFNEFCKFVRYNIICNSTDILPDLLRSDNMATLMVINVSMINYLFKSSFKGNKRSRGSIKKRGKKKTKRAKRKKTKKKK